MPLQSQSFQAKCLLPSDEIQNDIQADARKDETVDL